MSMISDLLNELKQRDIRLWVEEGRLKFDAPKDALTEPIKARILQAKPKLIEFLSKVGSVINHEPIPKVSREKALPVSLAQRRLFHQDHFGAAGDIYHMRSAFRIFGPLNLELLTKSFNTILRRHEILRTGFIWRNEDVVQTFAPSLEIEIPVITMGDYEAPETAVRDWIREEVGRPFDLAKPPLLRVSLLGLNEQDHVLVFIMHHIVSDGWSLDILSREFMALYSAAGEAHGSGLSDLPIQYADYAHWQRHFLEDETLTVHQDYWRQRLAGLPALLELPFDRARPVVQNFRMATHNLSMDPDLCRGLSELSQRAGASMYMTLLAAYQILLAKYSGTNDFATGTMISTRTRRELEPLIGFFVNILVIRSEIKGSLAFNDLLLRVKDQVLESRKYQELPFDHLVKTLNPERSLSHAPIVQALLTYSKPTPGKAGADRFNLPGLEVTRLVEAAEGLEFDLVFRLTELNDTLHLHIQYSSDLFDSTTIERMADHFSRILSIVTQAPSRAISEIDLLSAKEHNLVVTNWNLTEAEYPAVPSWVALMEKRVEQSPNKIAVLDQWDSLSYRHLNQRANRLACYLRGQGVGPGSFVAVFMNRSVNMLVALVAIHKAGGAYLPMDPTYPADRLAFMLDDTGAQILLTVAHLKDQLPAHQAEVILLEGDTFYRIGEGDDLGKNQSTTNLDRLPLGEHLAYVIHTSGSTGQPKGVLIQHRSLLNFLWDMAKAPGLSDSDTLLAVTTISFDIAGLELFLPLTVGASVVLADKDTASRGPALIEAIDNHSITVMQATPATWRLLTQASWQAKAGFRIICGGEALSRDLAEALLAQGDSVWNLYGPTEATIWATRHQVRQGDGARGNIQIGSPMANTTAFVFDRTMRPVPIGTPGELYLGGDCLAIGYLNRPGLTAERFLPNPFSPSQLPGTRLYKTGDLVAWQADGDLTFLGRIDQQIKLRGFRIELGEIEAVLQEHPDIGQATVVCHNRQGDTYLAAFVTGSDSGLPGSSASFTCDMRSYLSKHLPDYMIPWHFTVLNELPTTPNGKIDRRALQAIPLHIDAEQEQPPKTPTEITLAGIWSDILDRDSLDANAHFFAAGGHSLMAARLLARIHDSFGVELTLRHVFGSPRLHELATTIDLEKPTGQPECDMLVAITWDAEDPRPLSFAQERLWFLQGLQKDDFAYNMPTAVRILGNLDALALENAISAIRERHEVLRTCFKTSDGQPHALIDDPTHYNLETLEVDETEAQQLILGHARRPFDLERGPLARFLLFKLEKTHHILLVNLHHIVSDGWSRAVLIRDLEALYRGETLPPLPLQYADYAQWQRRRLDGPVVEKLRNWWRDYLADAPPLLALPTDFPRPQIQTANGATQHFEVDAKSWSQLQELAKQSETTLFMILQASLAALLSRYSNQKDILIGTTVANRDRRDLEGLIGLFVNTLVLRNDLSGRELSFRKLLGRTRQTALDVLEHKHLAFEQIVDAAGVERALNHSPLFQVMFALQNAPDPSLSSGDLSFEPVAFQTGIAKFDLSLSMKETAHGLQGLFEYNTDLFEHQTIQRMIGHFLSLLDQALDQPDQALADLPILDPEERSTLLAWSQGEKVARPWLSIPERISQHTALRGNQVAFARGEHGLTYRDLEQRSNQLAHLLLQQNAVNNLVGIYLGRGLQLPVVLLAMMKCGAAYVPLDPSYPADRTAFMIEDIQPELIVTTRALAEDLSEFDADLFILDEASLDGHLPAPEVPIHPATPAYAIFTSGSTGKPKAALIHHGALANLVDATNQTYAIGAEDRVLQAASFNFDLFAEELYPTLVAGGCVVMTEPGDLESFERFNEFIERHQITTLNLPPHFWATWLDELLRNEQSPSPFLKRMIVGSDKVKYQTLRQWLQFAPDIPVFNGYGPTETTVTALVCKTESSPCETYRSVPIGKPLANFDAYILDQRLALAPMGTPGELYLSGVGLASGYCNRPELTAERFIPNPFAQQNRSQDLDNHRLYRTGDLVRFLPDGQIDFLQRIDDQVKIRGFRIELGEIEAVLQEHGEVKDAVVLLWQDPLGESQIGAFVEVWEPDEIDADILLDYLRDQLPGFMTPRALKILEAMPLNPSGKVDRKKLPIDTLSQQETEYVAPQTETEIALAEIWAALLKVPRIGIHDDFFKLGGHSLLIAQLVARAKERFQLNISMKTLFTTSTLAGLAREIDNLIEVANQTAALQAQPGRHDSMEEFEF